MKKHLRFNRHRLMSTNSGTLNPRVCRKFAECAFIQVLLLCYTDMLALISPFHALHIFSVITAFIHLQTIYWYRYWTDFVHTCMLKTVSSVFVNLSFLTCGNIMPLRYNKLHVITFIVLLHFGSCGNECMECIYILLTQWRLLQ